MRESNPNRGRYRDMRAEVYRREEKEKEKEEDRMSIGALAAADQAVTDELRKWESQYQVRKKKFLEGCEGDG